MMSSTHVTRRHSLKSFGARLHRPRAPSSRTTKGLRCWGSGRIVPDGFPLPACASRFRINQEFRQRFGRAGFGIDGIADPYQRFLLLLPLLASAQLRFELDRLLLEHRDTLAVKTDHQELSLSVLLGHGSLRIEGLIVLRRLLRHRHQDALGEIEVKEPLEQARTLLEGVLDLEQGHPLLQEIRVASFGEVDLRVQREDPGLPGRAVARPGHCKLAEEREIVPPSQLPLPWQDHAVSSHDCRSHISRSALGEVQLHRRQSNGQQPLEDTLLRFVRLELARMFPNKLEQRLERLLAFRDTHLDIEGFHGDSPDVVKHRNTAQMFPGFYHGRRIPCTQKPSSRATVTLNSFHVHSKPIGFFPTAKMWASVTSQKTSVPRLG